MRFMTPTRRAHSRARAARGYGQRFIVRWLSIVCRARRGLADIYVVRVIVCRGTPVRGLRASLELCTRSSQSTRRTGARQRRADDSRVSRRVTGAYFTTR